MSIIKRILSDLHIMNPIYPLCAGFGMAILGIVTLMSCGCHPIYSWMLLPRGALPYWLFALLGIMLFFLLGAALGFLFSTSYCKRNVYICVILLICDIVLTMIWYHLLFRSFHTFLSIIILLAIIGIELLILRTCTDHNSLVILSIVPICLIRLHLLWLNIGIRFLN